MYINKAVTFTYLLVKNVVGIVDFSVWIENNLYFLKHAIFHYVIIAFHFK